MRIEGSVALVTGANRGLGRHFAEQLLARGAAKVYAAARNPDSVTLDDRWHHPVRSAAASSNSTRSDAPPRYWIPAPCGCWPARSIGWNRPGWCRRASHPKPMTAR